MTAAELIKILQEERPDTRIVVRGSDHSYRRAVVSGTEKAVIDSPARSSREHMSEYYGEQTKYQVIDVLVIE